MEARTSPCTKWGAKCTAAGKTLAEADKTKDHCVQFYTKAAVTTGTAAPAENTCTMVSLATKAGAEVRKAKADVAGPPKETWEAW